MGLSISLQLSGYCEFELWRRYSYLWPRVKREIGRVLGVGRNWQVTKLGSRMWENLKGKGYQCRILSYAVLQSKYHSFNLLVKASTIQVELNIIEGILYIDEGYINCELAIYWWTHQGMSFPSSLILFHCENVITFGAVILNALKWWEPLKRYFPMSLLF